MTDASRLDLDQHFAGLRALQLHRLYRQRRACLMRERCTNIHGSPLEKIHRI